MLEKEPIDDSMQSPQAPEPDWGAACWEAAEDAIDAISRRASERISPEQFATELLEQAAITVQAVGGTYWQIRPGNQFHALATRVPETLRVALSEPTTGARLRRITQTTEPAAEPFDTSGQWLAVSGPWHFESAARGLIELYLPASTTPAAVAGCQRFVVALAEIAADYDRELDRRELQRKTNAAAACDSFALSAHQSLELDSTSYTLVNEARRVTACSRVSLLRFHHGRFQLLAISGLDTFDPRTAAVRSLETLATSIAILGQPWWFPPVDAAELPPEIQQPLDEHLDQSHARVIGILPLNAAQASDAPHGCMIFEQFDAADAEQLPAMTTAITQHAALALKNAMQYESLPLASVSRQLARLSWFRQGKRLPMAIVAAICLLGLLLAGWLVPATLQISATGDLQPIERNDVYAPAAGVIEKLFVEHGDRVTAGQPIAVLRQAELERELSAVQGSISTAKKRAAALAAARVENPRNSDAERREYNRLTSEAEEIGEQLISLRQQLDILAKQQEQLTIRSPIAGQVLTWSVHQLLSARPVQPGQALLTVARLDGPWQLILHVPDSDIRHVLSAQAKSPQLPVTFYLGTDPTNLHTAHTDKIALTTTSSNTTAPLATVEVTASLPQDLPLKHPRPGATVTAKIHSGQASIAYVWFHQLWDTVMKWLWF